MATLQSNLRPVGGEESPIDRFREYLRDRKLRLTPERRSVLETILKREGHFDAEELLQFLRRRNQRVSRATLYRTLDHLRGAGLVWMHRFGGGQALYEHVYGRTHHDHMVCTSCQRVIEFVNEDIERLQEEMCRQHGFRSASHVMQIFGLCSTCEEREAAGRS
jgi:Fur family transcriptional regulator, ferric uptake regulator